MENSNSKNNNFTEETEILNTLVQSTAPSESEEAVYFPAAARGNVTASEQQVAPSAAVIESSAPVATANNAITAPVTVPATNVVASAPQSPAPLQSTNLQSTGRPLLGDTPQLPITKNAHKGLSGNGEARSTIEVYDNGFFLLKTPVDANGRWSFTPGNALADGEHSYQVRAIDRAGNVGQFSAPYQFIVDTQAPDRPLITQLADGDSALNNGSATHNLRPTLGGDAEANSTVKVYGNGVLLGSTIADSSGHWVFSPTTNLAEQSYNFTVTATDRAGWVSPESSPVSLLLDATAPGKPAITQVIDDEVGHPGIITAGGESDDNTPIFSGTAEPRAVIKLYDGNVLIGETDADSRGRWTLDVEVPLVNGNHSITVTATDAAGNTSVASDAFVFNVVPVMGTLTIDGMSKDSGVNDHDFVTADGTAGRGIYGSLSNELRVGQKVQVSLDGGATWHDAVANGTSWAYTDTTVHNSNWTIQSRIIDGLGNVNYAQKDVTLLMTVSAPGITSIPDAVGGYTEQKALDGSDVTVSLQDTGAKAGDTLRIQWGKETVDHVLTQAEIDAHSATFNIPSENTVRQGSSYDFTVTAQIVAQDGVNSSPSNSYKVTGSGVLMIGNESFDSYTGGGFVSDSAHFTMTTSGSYVGLLPAGKTGPQDSDGQYVYIGDGSGAMNNASITLNFDKPVKSISYLLWGLENNSGNGSWLEVYDTNGRQIYNPLIKYSDAGMAVTSYSDLWAGQVNYTAPAGVIIGKVKIYCDKNGVVVDNFSVTYLENVLDPQDAVSHHQPQITDIPDATGGYNTEKAADGSDMTVSLQNTGAKAGDTLHIVWGHTTYDQVLTQADITAGSLTINVPSQQTQVQGGINDFTVTAQIIGQNGEIGAVSSGFAVVGAGAVIDQVQAFNTSAFSSGATMNGYVSESGGFTVTGSNVTKRADNSVWSLAISGSMWIAGWSTATIAFDDGRSNVKLSLTGIEPGSNYAVIRVYDVHGVLLKTENVRNPSDTKTAQIFDYTAEGELIGKVEVQGDDWGTHILEVESSKWAHGTDVAGINLIDHNWETFYGTAGDDVVSMSVDPLAYFAQEGTEIHGGTGVDTLKLTGAGQVLDLSGLTGFNDAGKISGIEKFDITGTGDNTLKISLNDVLNLGQTDLFLNDGNVQVMVNGDSGDRVELSGLHDTGVASGQWVAGNAVSIDGTQYQVYQNSAMHAELLVQNNVTIELM